VVSFYASARSLQIGQAVEVIVIMSVAANLSAIIGGILVVGETIGTGGLGITARVFAFCLVIAGAALVPAPRRRAPAHRSTRPTKRLPLEPQTSCRKCRPSREDWPPFRPDTSPPKLNRSDFRLAR
jgi:hypothetical protein